VPFLQVREARAVRQGVLGDEAREGHHGEACGGAGATGGLSGAAVMGGGAAAERAGRGEAVRRGLRLCLISESLKRSSLVASFAKPPSKAKSPGARPLPFKVAAMPAMPASSTRPAAPMRAHMWPDATVASCAVNEVSPAGAPGAWSGGGCGERPAPLQPQSTDADRKWCQPAERSCTTSASQCGAHPGRGTRRLVGGWLW